MSHGQDQARYVTRGPQSQPTRHRQSHGGEPLPAGPPGKRRAREQPPHPSGAYKKERHPRRERRVLQCLCQLMPGLRLYLRVGVLEAVTPG